MTMSFIGLVRAQEINERLPNGDLIVTVEGKRYVALTGDHAHEMNVKLDRLTQLETALPICQQINLDLRTALDASKSQVVTANLQTQSWHDLFDVEHALRLKADSLIKHPGKVSSFFNSVPGQVITKVLLPVAGMIVSAKQ